MPSWTGSPSNGRSSTSAARGGAREYFDFEDREAAGHALHADLKAIDEHWGEVLHAGYMDRPDDTPEPLDH